MPPSHLDHIASSLKNKYRSRMLPHLANQMGTFRAHLVWTQQQLITIAWRNVQMPTGLPFYCLDWKHRGNLSSIEPWLSKPNFLVNGLPSSAQHPEPRTLGEPLFPCTGSHWKGQQGSSDQRGIWPLYFYISSLCKHFVPMASGIYPITLKIVKGKKLRMSRIRWILNLNRYLKPEGWKSLWFKDSIALIGVHQPLRP